MVLGQLPRWKIVPPTLKLTLNPNLTLILTGETIFLGGNCPETFTNMHVKHFIYMWNSTLSQSLDFVKVGRMVEIFKMRYFSIFHGQTIIYIKYWLMIKCWKSFLSPTAFKEKPFLILFTKIFFEKVFCNVFLKEKQQFHLTKHVLFRS